MRIAITCLSLTLLAGVVRAEQIENPSYKLWSQYNPGTTVKINGQSEVMGTKSMMSITTTLKEKTDDKLVITVQTSINAMGKDINAPLQTQEVPKMIDEAKVSPNTPSADQIAKATEETVTVPAGTFKCKKLEIHKTQGQAGGIDGATYYSDEVPGGMVKTTMTGSGAMQSTTTMELQSIDKK